MIGRRKRSERGGPTDLPERAEAIEFKRFGGTTRLSRAGTTSAGTYVRPLYEPGMNETLHPPAQRRRHPQAGNPALRAAARRAQARVRA